jgi:predicted lipid carrier protein YhbT
MELAGNRLTMIEPTATKTTPQLPVLLQAPLRILPQALKTAPLQIFLNTVFAEQLADDELEFLEERRITIAVSDAHLEFSLTVSAGALIVGPALPDPELRIQSTIYSLMQLATGTEDSDTLFFRRDLKMTGDTELGLFIKNFLEGISIETLPLQPVLGMSLNLGLRVADTTARLRGKLPF